MNYYNEFDPQAAQWLRNLIAAGLIPAGDVDERSIEDVKPNELRGYTQCHFFAGIAGWSLALDLAGWPRDRPVWTGSCPCQPFSAAGKGDGFADQRHLWPAWFHLIRQCRPEFVFGEQVASAIRHGWLDLVSADMEAEGYAVGGAVLGAHSVGAPHIRQRLYWVADANAAERRANGSRWHVSDRQEAGRNQGHGDAGGRGADRMADASGARSFSGAFAGVRRGEKETGARHVELERHRQLGDASNPRPQGHGRLIEVDDAAGWQDAGRHGATPGFWAGEWRTGADGKARLLEPKYIKMVDGISCRMVPRGSDCGAGEEVNWKEETAGPGKALRGLRCIDGAEDVSVYAGGYDGVSQAQVLRSGVHGSMDGGQDKSPGRASAVSSVKEGGRGQVRDLRENGDDTACAPQGREPDEQCGIELDDFVRLLPSSRAFAKLHGDRETEEALLAVCAASGAERLLQYPSHQVEAAWRSLGAESHDLFRMAVAQAGFVRTIETPLAHGIPRGVVRGCDYVSAQYANNTAEARTTRLRAYGNSIVPQAAAAFIRSFIMAEQSGFKVAA